MAIFEFTGVTELNEAFSRASDLSEEVKNEILREMGDTAKAAVRQSGLSEGIYDEENSGTHLLDSLALSKPKITENGGSIKVYFRGLHSVTRAGKKTPQGAVALFNEYGTKKQRARPFVRPALVKKQKKIIEAGEKVFHRWINSKFRED